MFAHQLNEWMQGGNRIRVGHVREGGSVVGLNACKSCKWEGGERQKKRMDMDNLGCVG